MTLPRRTYPKHNLTEFISKNIRALPMESPKAMPEDKRRSNQVKGALTRLSQNAAKRKPFLDFGK